MPRRRAGPAACPRHPRERPGAHGASVSARCETLNWDDGHETLARFVRETLIDSEVFGAKQRKDVAKDVDCLLDHERPETEDDVYDRLVERVVDRCRAHPEPVPHRHNPKLRR